MKIIGVIIFVFISFINIYAQNPVYKSFELPDNDAVIFAENLVSTFMNDRDITISPDFKEIYFSVLEGDRYVIVCTEFINNHWTKPHVLPFCGTYSDIEAMLSPDGKRLYFASNRPLKDEGSVKDFDIWYVERIDDGWSTPVNLGAPVNTEKNEFYPSVAHNGNLYFTTHEMNIAISEFDGEKYKEPVLLSDSINTKVGEYNAFIAPDESYIVYTSHGKKQIAGRGDLFIAYRNNNGQWMNAKCMSKAVNGPDVEMCPFVSFDGKYLFYSSLRKKANENEIRTYEQLEEIARKPQNGKFDIYWISMENIFKE